MRGRIYDPLAGVWLSRDPIGFAGGDWNLYRFVFNNPVTWIDPSGLGFFSDIGNAFHNFWYGDPNLNNASGANKAVSDTQIVSKTGTLGFWIDFAKQSVQKRGTGCQFDRQEAERWANRFDLGLLLASLGAAGTSRALQRVPSETLARAVQQEAQSPLFIERALHRGFTTQQIEALPQRLEGMTFMESLTGANVTETEFVIGRYNLGAGSRAERIRHELGHVLDDVANPGLFQRSLNPAAFGYKGFKQTEATAYFMQFGRERPTLQTVNAFNQRWPYAIPIGIVAGTSGTAYVTTKALRRLP
jgi:hypothetical protein